MKKKVYQGGGDRRKLGLTATKMKAQALPQLKVNVGLVQFLAGTAYITTLKMYVMFRFVKKNAQFDPTVRALDPTLLQVLQISEKHKNVIIIDIINKENRHTWVALRI